MRAGKADDAVLEVLVMGRIGRHAGRICRAAKTQFKACQAIRGRACRQLSANDSRQQALDDEGIGYGDADDLSPEATGATTASSCPAAHARRSYRQKGEVRYGVKSRRDGLISRCPRYPRKRAFVCAC